MNFLHGQCIVVPISFLNQTQRFSLFLIKLVIGLRVNNTIPQL